MRSAGACNGTFDLAACLEEGYAAGDAAARVGRHAIIGLCRPSAQPCGISSGKAFVDFQNDVTAKDLRHRHAGRLPLDRARQALHHDRHGDRPGQDLEHECAGDRVPACCDRPIPQVGHTTFRMPYTPVTFGALAGTARGDLFEPVRRTPIHDWAVAHGAVFENVGTWQRARWFPRERRGHAPLPSRANAAPCATRSACSTPPRSARSRWSARTPAEFLDRIYTGSFTRLAPGRCRYGVLLSEAGFVMDDGVVARLAPDRFHVTTTTGGAAGVLHHMEDYLQTEFPELRVWLTSITEQWAVIAVQGPLARQVIAPLIAGYRSRAGRDAAHERARRSRLRRSGAAVPCQLHRRARATRSMCRRTTDVPSGRQCTLPANRMASRPTGPRRCTCCAPRKATSSSARKPMAR